MSSFKYSDYFSTYKCLWLLNILEHLSPLVIRHNKNIFRTFIYIGHIHPKSFRVKRLHLCDRYWRRNVLLTIVRCW